MGQRHALQQSKRFALRRGRGRRQEFCRYSRQVSPLLLIAPIAFWAAIIGPIQSVAGWAIAGALWPEYDPVRLTISDLAAPTSPVNLIMSAFFLLGGTLTLIAALFARTFAMPGRVVLFAAAICTYGLTIFPTPLNGVSDAHRFFAIGSFALSAAWPLFAMRFRSDAPMWLRPVVAISATVLQAIIAIAFLIVWADPATTNIGVWERLVAFTQSAYISFVVIACYLGQRAARERAQETVSLASVDATE